ncbi:hypothetical protein DMUE_2040, partial [Dictyocoela muelleri]
MLLDLFIHMIKILTAKFNNPNTGENNILDIIDFDFTANLPVNDKNFTLDEIEEFLEGQNSNVFDKNINTIFTGPTQSTQTNTSQILDTDLNPSPGNSNNTKTIINKIQKFEIINLKIQLELLELFNYRQVCFNLKIIEDD